MSSSEWIAGIFFSIAFVGGVWYSCIELQLGFLGFVGCYSLFIFLLSCLQFRMVGASTKTLFVRMPAVLLLSFFRVIMDAVLMIATYVASAGLTMIREAAFIGKIIGVLIFAIGWCCQALAIVGFSIFSQYGVLCLALRPDLSMVQALVLSKSIVEGSLKKERLIRINQGILVAIVLILLISIIAKDSVGRLSPSDLAIFSSCALSICYLFGLTKVRERARDVS